MGIDVIVIFKSQASRFSIYKIKQGSTEYLVDKVGFNYDKKVGDTRFHIFGVQSKGTFLKLIFNTKNLTWRLLEISFIGN